MRIRKLQQLGSSHIIALVGVLVLVGIGGSYIAYKSMSHADQRYACGSSCNGKSPNWAIPGNGIQCSKSAKVVNSKKYTYARNTLTVSTVYSSVCQTVWLHVDNGNLINYGSTYSLVRGIAPTCKKTGQTPSDAQGTPKKSFDTVMADDHSSNYGKAVKLSYDTTVGDPSGNPNLQQDYKYSFSY